MTDVINLLLPSHRVVHQIHEVSDFSNKDFDSTNYGWNTTSPMMSSLLPKIPHGSSRHFFFENIVEDCVRANIQNIKQGEQETRGASNRITKQWGTETLGDLWKGEERDRARYVG